jgi:hypothetical protein
MAHVCNAQAGPTVVRFTSSISRLNRRNMPLTAMTFEAWRHWHIVNDRWQPSLTCWAAATRWSICPFQGRVAPFVLGAIKIAPCERLLDGSMRARHVARH